MSRLTKCPTAATTTTISKSSHLGANPNGEDEEEGFVSSSEGNWIILLPEIGNFISLTITT